MAGLVEAVRANVDESCIGRRCRTRGCTVGMRDAPRPNVLIKMDCRRLPIGGSDTRCDFMFVGDDCVVALELKKGRAHASEIVEQLRAGARFADSIVPRGARVRFFPVAVFGGIRKEEREQFRRTNFLIRFRGKNEEVRLLECGQLMVDALRRG